jgi:hypothetical protein
LYSLRNRPEKLAKGSLFCLFLKLVQINFIFTDNVRILYICFYSLILLVSVEAANTKFYSLWFDSGLNPGLSVLQWIETRTYRSRVDWTQDLLCSSGLNPGLTVLKMKMLPVTPLRWLISCCNTLIVTWFYLIEMYNTPPKWSFFVMIYMVCIGT